MERASSPASAVLGELAQLVSDNDATDVNLSRRFKHAADAARVLEFVTNTGVILKTLYLDGNELNDVAVSKLAQLLKTTTTLDRLNLCGSIKTDSGIKELAKGLIVNDTLKFLDITDCLMTMAGLRCLETALTGNCSITCVKANCTDGDDSLLQRYVKLNADVNELVSMGPHRCNPNRLRKLLIDCATVQKYSLLPHLLTLGADASCRNEYGQTAHALLLASPGFGDFNSLVALFRSHFEVDSHVSKLLADNAKFLLFQKVATTLAAEDWRSADGEESTVLHAVLRACEEGRLSEAQTVSLIVRCLAVAPQQRSAKDVHGEAPTTVAMRFQSYPLVQAQLNTILFDRYCALPLMPMSLSEKTHVRKCADLDEHVSINSSHELSAVIVKAMKNQAGWVREIQARTLMALHGDNNVPCIVPVERLVYMCNDTDGSMNIDFEWSAKIYRIPHTAPLSSASERAHQIMLDYPHALVMPAADCTMRACHVRGDFGSISLKELASVIGKLLDAVKKIHDAGLFHMRINLDHILKRDDGSWMLAGFSNSVSSTNDSEYNVTPVLVENEATWPPESSLWHVQCEIDAEKPHVPFAEMLDTFGLVSPEQVDLWSVGLVLFEICSGHELFGTEDGRLTDVGRQKLTNWTGLCDTDIGQITAALDVENDSPIISVIAWLLKGSATARPLSVLDVLSHDFFLSEGVEGLAKVQIERHKEAERAHLHAKVQAENKAEEIAKEATKILREKKKLEKVASTVKKESEELQEQQNWDWEEIASLKAQLAQCQSDLEEERKVKSGAKSNKETTLEVKVQEMRTEICNLRGELSSVKAELEMFKEREAIMGEEVLQLQREQAAPDNTFLNLREEPKEPPNSRASQQLEAIICTKDDELTKLHTTCEQDSRNSYALEKKLNIAEECNQMMNAEFLDLQRGFDENQENIKLQQDNEMLRGLKHEKDRLIEENHNLHVLLEETLQKLESAGQQLVRSSLVKSESDCKTSASNRLTTFVVSPTRVVDVPPRQLPSHRDEITLKDCMEMDCTRGDSGALFSPSDSEQGSPAQGSSIGSVASVLSSNKLASNEKKRSQIPRGTSMKGRSALPRPTSIRAKTPPHK